MDEATARELLRVQRVARLATVDPTGHPHVVPVCFALDDGVIYSAVDAKPKSTLALRRLDNVRLHPRVAVLVDHYDDTDWATLWWVRADGDAEILDVGARRARGLDLLAEKYAQYRAQPPPGPVIAVTVARWRAWSASPLG